MLFVLTLGLVRLRPGAEEVFQGTGLGLLRLAQLERAVGGLGLLQHHLDLNLLDFGQPLPLPVQKMIDLFVQVADFQFGLQVDLVIVERAQPIL